MQIALAGGSDGPVSFFFVGTLGDVILIPVILAALVIGGIFLGRMISRRKRKK